MKTVSPKICLVENCNKVVHYRGMCAGHANRAKRGVPLDAPWRGEVTQSNFPCSVENCDRPAKTKMMCPTHYMRSRNGLNLTDPIHTPGTEKGICSVRECDKPAETLKRGICANHRALFDRGRKYPTKDSQASQKDCTITGCFNKIQSSGLCNKHCVKKTIYRLSAMQLDMLYRRGKCDSCGDSLELGEMMIDHDHACCGTKRTCGQCVRGILCGACNAGLGSFGDDTRRLVSAIAYLERAQN